MHFPDKAQALVDAIRQRAWNSAVSLDAIPSQMKSMILWPEQKLLHWLARELYCGEGAIGDLGCFIGSSTLSLATGLAAGSDEPPHPVIHSYDLFIAPDDPYTLQRLPQDHGPGDRFRDVFEANIRPMRGWIEIHDGDLREDPWQNGPIEILFIDICKCWSTNQAVLRNFFPHLIPGHSIVVHQDFVRVWNPWIPVSMAFLKDFFEVLAEEESSRVYRCVKAVPESVLKTDFRRDLDLSQKRALLEESIRESANAHTAAVHKGALAMLVFMEGDADEARSLLESAIGEHADDEVAQGVYRNLVQTMDYWKTGSAYEKEMEDKF
jgi:hypothetical protein